MMYIVLLISSVLFGAPCFAHDSAEKESYLAAIERNPNDVQALFQLGNWYYRTGTLEDALQCYKKAHELQLTSAQISYNMGLCYKQLQRVDGAITSFKHTIERDPHHKRAWQHLGTLYFDQKQYDNATVCFDTLIALEPSSAEAYASRARIARAEEQHDQALSYLDKAAQLGKDDLQFHFERAYLHTTLGQTDKSIALYEMLIERHPRHIQIIYNLGFNYKMANNIEKAIECYKRALAINPEYEAAQFGLGMAYLMVGDFKRGWKQHELYLKRSGKNGDALRALLQHESLEGKTILLRPEGGLGDTLQFIRHAKDLKARGAHIIASVQKPLLHVLKQCEYIDKLVPSGRPLPPHDAYSTYMSLPAILDMDERRMGKTVPYLHADPDLVAQWAPHFKNVNELKVGICWQADVYNDSSRLIVARRGIPLMDLYPLKYIPNVRFYSLQKMDGVDQLQSIPDDFNIHTFGDDFDESHGSFMDTAAVMMHLDLIITVDTAIAHLAGGLGRPVWLMLPYSTDWRWLAGRTDSPWYPTMKIFKQPAGFDWESVVRNVFKELSRLKKG